MISEKQLEEWRQQSLKDAEAYRADEERAKQLQGDGRSSLRVLIEKLRGRYINFQSDQNGKLNRLLMYTEMEKEMEHYPQIMRAYVTFNTCSIIVFAACILAPKKIISKILASLVVYGIKKNILDGMFTYYMVENMALSTKMTEQQQELRNVVEFHYMHKFFKKVPMGEEDRAQAARLIANIQKLNATYAKFKQVEQLI